MEIAVEELAKTGLKTAKRFTHEIERKAREIPSESFVAFGLGCCVCSTIFGIMKMKKSANTAATWGATALLLAIYQEVSARR